jgi:hypothetical protein
MTSKQLKGLLIPERCFQKAHPEDSCLCVNQVVWRRSLRPLFRSGVWSCPGLELCIDEAAVSHGASQLSARVGKRTRSLADIKV